MTRYHPESIHALPRTGGEGRSGRTAIRPKPLTAEELARAEQVAQRLHESLGMLVLELPEHARGASGMARYLRVVRNTCQRVVATLAESPPTAGMLARLPGIQGLQQIAAAFRRIEADEAGIAAVEAAIKQFAQLIRELAGSQSRLADRLARAASGRESEHALPPAQAALAARKNLFDAAADVTGRQCDVFLSIYCFRIHPDGQRLERVLAQGRIGQTARPDAMPFAFRAGDTRSEEKGGEGRAFASLDRTPAHGHTPHAILERFASDPLPLVVSRGSEGQLVQMIDHTAAPPGQPFDVVVANRSAHPAMIPGTDKSSLDEVWTLLNYPSRWLVLDVYLHRDMERMFR